MSSPPDTVLQPPGPRAPTVFLSYASEDRSAAQALRDALPAYGVEVWYDETDLAGGDAWDQKIRRQIRDCDFFMPVISAQTEARHEGYFRREWRLAAERSLDMSDDHLFLLPVVIDGTSQAGARVPEKFLSVQWTRVAGGQPNAAFESLCRRLLMGDVRPPAPSRPTSVHRGYTPVETGPPEAPASAASTTPGPKRSHRAALARPLPPLPQEVPGQRARFVLEVLVWAVESAWVLFNRLPGVFRGLAYTWAILWLLSNVFGHHRSEVQPSQAQASQLSAVAARYNGQRPEDIAHLGKQVKHALGDAVANDDAGSETPLLAIPFSAPAHDEDALKLADTAFAQVYGRLALSHHGHLSLLEEPLASVDNATALDRARQQHADYVLFGALTGTGSDARLTVTLLEVDDGSEAWSKSYPVQGIDTAALATEVDERVQQHD